MDSDRMGGGAVTPVWARSVVGGGVTAGIVHVASTFARQIVESESILPATLIAAAIVALCSIVADLDRRTPRGMLALGSGLCVVAGILVVYSLASMSSQGRTASAGVMPRLGGNGSSILLLLAVAVIGAIRSGRDQAHRLAGGVTLVLLTTGSGGVAAYVLSTVIVPSLAQSSSFGSSSWQFYGDIMAALTGGFFTFSLIVVQMGVLGRRAEEDD